MRIARSVLAGKIESLTNAEWIEVLQPWSEKIAERFKEKTLKGIKLGDFPCLHIGSFEASIYLRHASQRGHYKVKSVKGITLDSRGLFGNQAKNYQHFTKSFWGFLHTGDWVIVEINHFNKEYDSKKFDGVKIEPLPYIQIAENVRIRRVKLDDLIEICASPVQILNVLREAIEKEAKEHRYLAESLQRDQDDLMSEIENLRLLDKNFHG